MEVGSFLNSLLATDPRPSGALISLLFDLLIGETFSVNKKIQVRSAVVIPYLLDILATSEDPSLRDQIFEKFLHLLSNSQNVDLLCNVLRLSESIMDMMTRAKDQKLFDQLSRLLSLLGNHSFNSKQLKTYYELLERRENSSADNPRRQLSLVQCFQSMTKRQTGPHSFFHFNGNEAGIMVQRVDKWPKSGYAFCSWIRIETLQDPKTGSFSYQPRLFSFSSAEGAVIEVFIERSLTRGNTLHVRAQVNSTTAPSTVELANYDFQLQKWHFVSIVHSYKILGRSDVSLYINGQLIQSSLLKYPTLERGISGNIGINPKVDPSGSFFGQMGTIFFFKEPIGQPQIAKILALKPNVIIGPSEIAEVGANSLFFVYPPQACFGQFCFDANTGPNGEGVPQPSHGLKLSGVQEVISFHVTDSYHCAIGIEGLYPFILAVAPQNKTKTSSSLEVDLLFRTALHAEWIALLSNFVDHPSIQAEMMMQNSLELLGYIQQKLPPKSITGQTLSSFEHLINCFSATEELKRQAYFNLLFNFQLWIYTDLNTQTHFLLTLASHMQRDPQYFKSLFGVQQWLDVLRSYYWYRSEPDSLCVEEVVDRKTQQVVARRPSNPTEIKELRSHIVLMLHLMLKEEIVEEEVLGIVRFIHDCTDPLQLQDLLQFVLSLLSAADSLSLRHNSRALKSSNDPPKGLIKALKKAGGASIFYTLLQQEEEPLRVLGIQLIDIYNKQVSNYQKVSLGQLGSVPLGFDFDEGFCFFSNTLMDYNFTEPVYRALLQALFDDYQLTTPLKYSKQKIHTPKLIGTIWQLLHNSSLELRHEVLADFIIVLQQCTIETREIFLSQLGWQSWLLPLIPLTIETPLLKNLREDIFTIFQLLFKHSFSKREGWMLLEQTDAFLTMFVRPTEFFCKLEVEIYEQVLSGIEDFKDLDNRDVVENCAFFVSFFEEILYVPAAATPDAEPVMQRDAKGVWTHWTIVQRLLALSYRLISSKHAESVNAVILKSRGKSFFATVIRLLMASITEAPTTFACRAINDKKADFKKVQSQLKQWIEARQQVEVTRKLPTGTQDLLERNAQRAFDLYIQDRLNNLDQEIKDLERFMEQTTKMLKAVLFKHIPIPGITTQQSSFNAEQLNRVVWVMNHLLYVTHTLQQYKLPVSDSLLLLQRDVIITYRMFVEKHINETFPDNLFLLEDINKVTEYLSFIMANQTIMQKLKTIRMIVDLEARQQLLNAQEERRKRVNTVREGVEKITRTEVMKELQLRSTASDLKKKNCYSEVNRRAAIAMQFAEKQGRLGRLWRGKLRTLSNQRSHLRPKATTERIFWKLDKTEDALRRRWKLKRNFNGSSHIEASVSFIKAQNAAKKAAATAANAVVISSSSTSSIVSSASESTLSPRNEGGQTDDVSKLIDLSSLNQQIKLSSSGLYDFSADEEPEQETISNEGDKMLPKEDPEWCVVQLADEMKATTFDTRLREEKVICSVVCELVSTFKTIHGKLDVTNQHVYFIADYDLSSGKVDSLSRKWPVSSLEKLMKRRYLLRDKAMEIFFLDQRNYFFDFAEKVDRDCALKGIQSAKPPNLTYDGRSPAELLRRSKLIEKWQRRTISNFEYLMHLNTIAGRSYNDLHQYHIFPWVLSDYTSQKLDLTDPNVYRDLSKPIGALNPARLKQLKDRCASLEGTDIPKFLYGSHYSNAGSVLYYMLRQEPYTSQFIALQGRFDHADRLFHSISQTWNNCLQAPQDVKELIPEFFYLPDFLLNSNSLDLGTTQTGTLLGDVELPPWANGSIHEFVRINREALESEYASEHLHEWIDLIFGYQQRGPAAEEADNLFYYLTYEGAVDIDAIDSPVIRKATEEQILNFGQCPTQLLTKPHPKRGKVQIIHKSVWTNPLNFQAYIYSKLTFTPHVVSVRDRLVIIGTDGEFISFNWNQNLASPPTVSNAQPTALSVADQCLVSPNKSVTTADFGHPFCFGLLSPTVAIYGGFWDNSFRLKQLTAQQPLLQSVREHKGPVTCLAISENNTTIATGSKDATVIIWKVETVLRGLAKYPAINERPVHILRGHTHEISAVAISSGVDIAVSGATDGTLLIHTLRSGRFVRKVENPLMSFNPSSSPSASPSSSGSGIPTSSSSSSVVSSSSSGSSAACVVGFLSIATAEGRIVMCSRGSHPHLAVFDINGNLVKCVQVMDNTGIASLVLSRDGKQVLTGGDQLSVRDLHSLKLIHAYDIVCRVASGQCLYVSQEGRNLFAALQNGDFLVFGYFVN